MNFQKGCRGSPSSRRRRPPQLAVDSREFVDLKMTLLTGTKGAFAQLGIHAARFRTRAGRRGSRPCRTSLHVLRGRRAYCVRLVLRDAADPRGEPWSRRLQTAATDGHDLHGAADVRARSDHARCRGVGAGNGWRIGAPVAGSEESQVPSKGTSKGAAPALRAARAPATAG